MPAGYLTAMIRVSAKMLRADQAHFGNIDGANNSLAAELKAKIKGYNAVGKKVSGGYNIGTVEDMNVLMQNSLWLNVPASRLDEHKQVQDLTGNKKKWSEAQLTLIGKIRDQINSLADNVIKNL